MYGRRINDLENVGIPKARAVAGSQVLVEGIDGVRSGHLTCCGYQSASCNGSGYRSY